MAYIRFASSSVTPWQNVRIISCHARVCPFMESNSTPSISISAPLNRPLMISSAMS